MYPSAQKPARIAAIVLFTFAVAACDIAVDSHGGFDFGLAAGKAADEWTRSFPLGAGGRIEIINVNGQILAEASDGSSVELRAERTAKAPTDEAARELLGKIEMREEVGDQRVRVEVRAPRMSGPSGHEIKWVVRVPRGVAVDLRTINGGVKMVGLDGDVRARSTNGGVSGLGLAATSVDAAVTNGGVEIELAKALASGSVDLEAVNGGVTLMLPPDSKADITGRCVNGGVSVTDLDLEVTAQEGEGRSQNARVQTYRRRVDGKLNGGGARISLETVNGGVKILRTGAENLGGKQGT